MLFAGASRSRYYRSDLGSFWLQVEVARAGRRLRSPGVTENDHRNLSPRVFRISIRRDDSYLGYLTTFFNVPGVFGSVPYQTQHYIGVDCADVLVAAHRRSRGQEQMIDLNVAMLADRWRTQARATMKRGVPSRELRFGAEVAPGHAIAVRYPSSRQLGHVGALYEDANGNGILDAGDTVLHAGPDALHVSKLGEGSFDGEIVILAPPSGR